jgi:aminoglycoside phosphotransferase family enzyme
MNTSSIPPYISALLNPSQHENHPEKVELLQTHISYVLIAGPYVYKFKKPVNFGFLDFSTLKKRGHYCLRELELNRRLCPDIYLERVTVTNGADGFKLGGDGEVIEYGVKMHRLDEAKMMVSIIGAGGLKRTHLTAIIDTLVPFYQGAATDAAIAAYGTAQAVGVNVLENFTQTEPFIGEDLPRHRFAAIRAYAMAQLARERWFGARVDGGHIKDCHGDLYSANICLDEPTHIFDCIEFNDRFRYADVAADIGFLAMDLDFYELDELSGYFVNQFARTSGDDDLLSYINFYKCYRAYVRGKINLFTAADDAVDEETATRCRQLARRYFILAERYTAG